MRSEGEPNSTSLLEVNGLSKRYDDDFRLNDISFRLPAGYVFGLIGPNGAGKTTIIKLLLGSIRADSGEVVMFGQSVHTRGMRVRARIGFVHETPPLYGHLSVEGYARIVGSFYPTWSHRIFRNTATRFELPMKKRVGSLSRGMKMKLALATAMSHEAELLILDEPTSGLDPIFRRELLSELRDYIVDGNRSILFSTHITSDLEHIADYILYLRNGTARICESVEALRESWRLVRGGNEALTAEVRSVLSAVKINAYGFCGITATPDAIPRQMSASISIEPVTFDDIVVLLEEEHE